MYIDKSIEYTIDVQTYTMTCKKNKIHGHIQIHKYTNTQIHKLHALL